MQTRNALSNLSKRYRAVLKKCTLLNTFGMLAIATLSLAPVNIAFAKTINNTDTSFLYLDTDSELINNANLSGGAFSINGIDFTSGVFAENLTSSSTFLVTNNGKISMTNPLGEFAAGMYSAINNGKVELINSADGDIEIEGMDSVYGLRAYSGSAGIALTNDGDMTLSGINTVGGLYAQSDALTDIILENNKTINILQGTNVFGMYAESSTGSYSANTGTANTLTNRGTISIINSLAPTGMVAYSRLGENFLVNEGGISIQAENGSAIAMNAESEQNSNSLQNNGTIDVVNNLKTAYGIRSITYIGNNNVTNSGTISLYSVNEKTYGIYAIVYDEGDNILSNSGVIDATSENQSAYGILLESYLDVEGSRVSNSGFINVETQSSAHRAAEVYGLSSYIVDDWTLTLRSWTDRDTVFGSSVGKIVSFDNSIITLRPGTQEQGFTWGDEYSLANAISINDSMQSSITGTISEIKTEVPFLGFTQSGTADAPIVSLYLIENNLPQNQINAQNIQNAITSMQSISTELSALLISYYTDTLIASNDLTGINAGSVEETNTWKLFASPYGQFTNNDTYGFNSNNYGITAGGSYNFSEQFMAGFHLNFSYANSDTTFLENDLFSFAIGAQASYFFNNNLYIRGNATYAFGSNDIKYHAIGSAKDDYNSNSFFAGVHTGYIFEINENNIIIPEIGLSYLYTSTDAYNLHFLAPYEAYNMNIHESSYSALYADISLKWEGNYAVGTGALSPSIGIGLRQNLTGSGIDSSVDMFGSRFETTANSDSTTFLANAGLEYSSGNFTFSVDYSGGFGSEQQSHTGSLQVIYHF